MFKHLFATMNDVLDQILQELPVSQGARKAQLQDELQVLKSMSDEFIECWLLFEEKMGKLQGGIPIPSEHLNNDLLEQEFSGKQSDEFVRGQGFYQLFMYEEAIQEFEHLVRRQPDFLLARIYLAMGYLRKGEYGEAYRHFQFLVPLTENAKLKAISYNAMGCIQIQNQNMDKAYEYFQKAYRTDPSCVEPLFHLDE